MKKKLVAIISTIAVMISACCIGLYAYASERQVDANKMLLESLINDRYWVIETLAFNDYTNNPYSELCAGASIGPMLDDVLSNYRDDEAFAVLVDLLQGYDDLENEVGNWSADLLTGVLEDLGIVQDENTISNIDSFSRSAQELRYEDIINDVIMEDYTASWGTTLMEENAEMEHYRQMSKMLKKLSNVQKALKDNNELLAQGCFESDEDYRDYVDNFLSAYTDVLYDTLTNTVDNKVLTDNEALTKKIIGCSALAFVMKCETYNPLKVNISDSAANGKAVSDFYFEWFADDVGDLLKGAGKGLKIASFATKYASILEALVSQTDSTVEVLNRIADNTSNDDLKGILDNYARMVKNQGDIMAYGGTAIIDYIANEGIVGQQIMKQSKKAFDKLLNLCTKHISSSALVVSSRVASNLTAAGECISVAVWVADKATNIKDTAKKIHICQNIQEIIYEAGSTFTDDYSAYRKNKTDENAKKCLDDLEFLKKLRLYGEKQAYGSICSQTESIAGLLLGGNSLSDSLEQRFQGNIDALLGCFVYKTPGGTYSVNTGENLFVCPWKLTNGQTTLYAKHTKADGSYYIFPEAHLILASNINLNKGSIDIYNNPSVGATHMFASAIRVTGDSTLNIRGSDLVIGYIENKAQLDINLMNSASTFMVTDYVDNEGTLSINGNGQEIKVQDIKNTNTINLNDATVNVYGDAENTGTVSGLINICGDETRFYEDGYYDTDVQTLSGAGSYSHLSIINNTKNGIIVDNKCYINTRIYSSTKRISASQNLTLKGNCNIAGNYFPNSLSFEEFNSNQSFTVNGIAILNNDVDFGGDVLVNDSLLTTADLSLGSSLTVKGDTDFKSGSINGKLVLYGDMSVSARNPVIEYLDFSGKMPQNISGNSITVSYLDNHNTSLKGVTTNTIYVTKQLYSENDKKYDDSTKIVLTDNALIKNGKYSGSLSASNWNVPETCSINGSLVQIGDLCLSSELSLTANTFVQNSGKLIVNSNSILKAGTFSGINVENNGTINVSADAILGQSFKGGELIIGGDVSVNGATVTPTTLKLNGKIYQSVRGKSINVENVEIDNSSLKGVELNSEITASKNITVNNGIITNPNKLVLTDNATITDNTGRASVGAMNWSPPDNCTIGGELYGLGDITIPDKKTFNVGSFIQSSGNLVIGNEAKLNVSSVFNSKNAVTNNGSIIVNGDAKLDGEINGGELLVKGDLSSGKDISLNKLTFESKLSQSFNNSGNTNIGKLIIKNTSKNGLTLNSIIKVSEKYENANSNIINPNNIVLGYDVDFFDDGVNNGGFSVSDVFNVDNDEKLKIKGTLTLKNGSVLSVKDGAELTVSGNIISNGATINVNEGGKLIIIDSVQLTSTTVVADGEFVIKGDSQFTSSTVSGNGNLQFMGDLNSSSCIWDSPNIAFVSKLPQTIIGNAMTANMLTVKNTARNGITINCNITCNSFNNDSNKINNIQKINDLSKEDE